MLRTRHYQLAGPKPGGDVVIPATGDINAGYPPQFWSTCGYHLLLFVCGGVGCNVDLVREVTMDTALKNALDEIEGVLAEILAVLQDIRIQGESHEVTALAPPTEHCEHLGAYHITAGWYCPHCGQIT